MKQTRNAHPFTIEAMVLLPEHLHCIWKLPENDTNYSMRWALIKKEFKKRARDVVGKMVGTAHPTTSRMKRGEGTMWQRRFWEHQIRDQEDYNAHVEYIHYNPVKHGLADAPKDWEHSSFHRFVRNGIYDRDWGAGPMIKFEEGVGKE